FAVWDKTERVLHLARDRIGKKPLYYGWADKTLLFGSELKALLAFPRFAPQVDRNSLALFLRHNYVPAPWCISGEVFNFCRVEACCCMMKSLRSVLDSTR